MKKILITGASGFLGHHIVCELLNNPINEVVAIIGRPEDKANPLPGNDRLSTYSIDEFFAESFADVDTVINCAFARSNDPQQLAESVDFTSKLIKHLIEMKVKSVINISSQGVYKRLGPGELSNEASQIVPIDLYSMTKYSAEYMFNVSELPNVTHVRLASLMMPQRFLYFFVKNAVESKPFTVTAPNQYAALLDVRDAATGLVAITNLEPGKRAGIYNLGIGVQYSLLDYANSVRSIGASLGLNVIFDVADNGNAACAGMDCSRLMQDTGWKPAYLKDEMIIDVFNTLKG